MADWKRNIISLMILILAAIGICMLVYKSQVELDSESRIIYTLMSAHKDNGTVVLSRDNPVIIEDFICNVDNLKKLQIKGVANSNVSDAKLTVEIIGLDLGKSYCKKKGKLNSFYNKKAKKKVFKLKKLPKESKGMMLRLIVTLECDDDTTLTLTANNKPGTVAAFNGVSSDYTNVIYRMRYGRLSELKKLYIFLCAWVLIIIVVLYYMIVIKNMETTAWFMVAALMIGMLVQWIIPVYGVPDEPWHMDTAYQLSNKMLRVDKEPQEGTVLKRKCDVVIADMLANDVESNSYYQLCCGTFDKPEQTELVRVAYVDSGIQVPDIFYLPAAIGITIGRLLNVSGMMMYQLARIMSLIFYVLMMWFAVRIIPFCNTLLSMIAISMITLQQAASASYDAMINGIIFLFIALCMRMAYGMDYKKGHIIVTLVLAVLIAMVKGGVYIPILFLAFLILRKQSGKKLNNKKAVLIGLGAVAVLGLMVWKFYPIFNHIISDGYNNGECYTPGYIVGHPLNTLYIYWRTVVGSGEKLLRGVYGGVLGWHNIIVSWIYMLPLTVCLYLLVHVENERPPEKGGYKVVSIAVSIVVIMLIMCSMLLTVTKVGSTAIYGLQGRYFIPVLLPLMSVLSTKMINVRRIKANKIIMVYILVEMTALMQVIVRYI